ncbi:MAG: geranylgeranyl reductase family protein [Acidimicrobiia bacterium]
MRERHFDALVIGAGPAGSIAAIVLARAGARVALVDKAGFPRDKACGDLIGPRGIQLLDELGLEFDGERRLDLMVVRGPSGRAVRMPVKAGVTYPGYDLTVPRLRFDALLRDAALAAGAEPVTGRADAAIYDAGALCGVELAGGLRLRSDVIIGADGATSRVATLAGLDDPAALLWGFAVRAYVDQPATYPQIFFWEPTPGRLFPGYGWLFPGPGGGANVGLGLGVGSDRKAGALAARAFPAFVEDLHRRSLLPARPVVSDVLGGWLKMGMRGTVPAGGRVLLVGDAAGLVNPLQGEGLSQAMTSGRAAAEAVLAEPGRPAPRYRQALASAYDGLYQPAARLHAALVRRPRVSSAVARVLTAPGVGRSVAGAWALYWNDLVDGAPPGLDRSLAGAARRLGRQPKNASMAC